MQNQDTLLSPFCSISGKIDLSIPDQMDNPQPLNHIGRMGKLIYRKPLLESNLK